MGSPKDILVVDDEPVVLESVRRSLRPEGLTLDLAGEAGAALELLEEREYKVVLCDVILPRTSGFEVLAAIRRRHPLTQTIMTTGYATSKHVIDSFSRDAFDFLPKPFDVEEQLAVVSRALRFYHRAATGEAVGGSADCRCLGRHAWALVDRDGSATLGVAETFRGTVGEIESVQLPAPAQYTAQGKLSARIQGRDRLVHQVWAPLSGRVIAINQELDSAPELVDRDPFGSGWLVRIVPDSADGELPNLTRHEPIRR